MMRIFLSAFLSAALLLGVSEANAGKIRQKPGEEREKPAQSTSDRLAKTSEGWLPSNEPGTDFVEIQFLPDNILWGGGFDASGQGFIFRSKDGGNTGDRRNLPTGVGEYVLAARDTNTALAGTFDGNILRTSDAGATWDTVFSFGDGSLYINGIQFLNPDTAIAVGDADADGYLVVRSTDAGLTWTRLTNIPAPLTQPGVYAASALYHKAMDSYGNTVWATAYISSDDSVYLLKSTDAGDTWQAIYVPLTGGTNNDRIRSINFLDDQVGFLSSRRTGTTASTELWMHRTTDGGVTWSDTINVEPGLAHVDQQVVSSNPIRGTDIVVAVGSGGPSATRKSKTWWSTDKGVTWAPIPTTGTTRLYKASFRNATQGYAVGYEVVLRYTLKSVRAVTFRLNTATVPDTIPLAGQTVQIRGGVNHAGGVSPITWGNDQQNNMTNIGGDYWQKTLQMQVGDTLRYKYVFNSPVGTGWEKGVVPADFPAETDANRSFIVPDQDSTLAVEFWNNGPGTRAQYFRPWSAPDDTFMVVYFRVNMLGPMASGSYGPYNNDTDTLAVRGGGPAGGDLNWSPSFYLTRETDVSNQPSAVTVNPLSFWSGALRLPKNGLTAGSSIGYKFLIGSDWNRPSGSKADEGTDRSFKVPVGLKDTTLHWVFFNNERPTSRANPDTVRIRYTANLAQAIQTGGFKLDDTLYVRSGFNATAQEQNKRKTMTRLSGTLFQVIDTIITAKGQLLDYQYYVQRGSTEQRENYYNFLWTGTPVGRAERRQVTVPNDASLTNTLVVLDTSTSITQARRMPVFPNARPLARNVKVTYTVDVRPAYYQVLAGDTLTDIQGTNPVEPGDKDSIFIWGVWMNGLAVGDWSNPGGDWGLGLRNNLEKKMYDDGTNGDVTAGDSIYSRFVYVGPDSTRGTMGRVGQIFKFGIYGGDNEGGRGGYGNNHNENVVDDDSVYTLESQFGSINPAFYDAWDYDNQRPSGVVSVGDDVQPLVFALAQNYPNPFNPATRIEYSIPVQSQVELKIYNIVGQEVATLVNEIQKPGVHSVKFDASKLATGVYLYRLTASNFVSTRKMILVK